MSTENLSAFQVAAAKDLERREHFASMLANTKKLVEVFCGPEQFVNRALSVTSILGPFSYEILEVRYENAPITTAALDGKSMHFEPAVIPVSVVIRDRLDKNLVFSITAHPGAISLLVRDIGRGSLSPNTQTAKAILDDTDAYRTTFKSHDPLLHLEGYDFDLNVVQWKEEVQAVVPEPKPRFKREKKNVNAQAQWKHWIPINSNPIRTFEDLKRAVENCPSDPAQGFFNQNAVTV